MEISDSLVGTTLKGHRAKFTWRDTTNYAAAVCDDNPVYFDDERQGGIFAPPMFATALTWQVSGRIWEYLESEDFPMQVLTSQVHYTEHFEFHRVIKPGDGITLKGTVASIQPHKAGAHIVIRYEAFNGMDEPVFTNHTGALLRGVTCIGEGRGGESLPDVPRGSGGETPDWEAPVAIDRLAPYVYDGCTDIVFPIHTSERFAKSVGLPGVILQGTATLAHAAREIVDREAGGDPERLKTLFCRFTSMVLPGTTIRVAARVESSPGGKQIFFNVINGDGRKALSPGYALIV